MQAKSDSFLKYLRFRSFDLWDTKRYTRKSISSKYEIIELGKCIKEENKKYKLFEEEETEFGILGVNNKIGIFDAYKQKGKEINQSYKRMEKGWLAYNPYRINVGSIGVKRDDHKYEYISPAYVVFSCKNNILPEYLFITFKTMTFNKSINENTTGSVRQNLTIDILKKLDIPLPSLNEQEKLVLDYYQKLNQTQTLEQEANDLEGEIERYFLHQLGLNTFITKDKSKGLSFINFEDIERWDFFSSDLRINNELRLSCYPLTKFGIAFNIAKRSWNKNQHKEDTFRYIEIGGIDANKGITETKEILLNKAPSRATQTVKEGDLIIGTTRPYLKKFAIVTNEYDENVCSSGFVVIEKSNKYHLPYLLQFLRCIYGVEQLKNRMTGGLYPAITESELKEIKVPMPDKDKQIEIMELVERKRLSIINNKHLVEKLKFEAEQEFETAIFK